MFLHCSWWQHVWQCLLSAIFKLGSESLWTMSPSCGSQGCLGLLIQAVKFSMMTLLRPSSGYDRNLPSSVSWMHCFHEFLCASEQLFRWDTLCVHDTGSPQCRFQLCYSWCGCEMDIPDVTSVNGGDSARPWESGTGGGLDHPLRLFNFSTHERPQAKGENHLKWCSPLSARLVV